MNRPGPAPFAALIALATCLLVAPALAAGVSTTRLAFTRKNSVYLAPVSGAHPRKLGTGDEPLVSPNGATVAVAAGAGGTNGVRLYDTVGHGSRVVLAKQEVLPVAFSHDSKYLAVAIQNTSTKGIGHAALDIVTVATGKVQQLTRGIIDGASFSPTSDTVVYASTTSLLLKSKVNLHTVSATGHGARQITHDGDSLNPVWGRKGIVFDRETYRGTAKFPEYQLVLIQPTGKGARQLSHSSEPALLSGLVPLQFSANGERLIADLSGEDTVEAYAVSLSPFKATEVKVDGRTATGADISRNGRSLLVDTGFESASGDVDIVPFRGGHAKTLTTGLEPSSNF